MIKKWLNTPLSENGKWLIEKLCYIPIIISLLFGVVLFGILEKVSYNLFYLLYFLFVMGPLLYFISVGSYKLQNNNSKGFREFCLSSTIMFFLILIGFFYKPNLNDAMYLVMFLLITGGFNLIFYKLYLHLKTTTNDTVDTPTNAKP